MNNQIKKLRDEIESNVKRTEGIKEKFEQHIQYCAKLKGFDAASTIYEKQRKKDKEREMRLVDGLAAIKSLTYSWVIAEETKNCKHTYSDIKSKINELLTTYKTETEANEGDEE